MISKEILTVVGENISTDKEINLEFFDKVFNDLVINKEKFKNAYLTLYMYEKFCKTKDIRTRKTSARDFEDFLSAISAGTITDSSKRHNKNDEKIFVDNKFITEWVVNNKREKADIIYTNGYKLTVKTLVEDNNEVNMGAFEKKALFSELNIVKYLEERKSSNKGIGLGSKPQLLKLLNIIKENGNWNKFSKRFIEMSKNIYTDDIIVFIKSSDNPKIYLINSDIFRSKMAKCIKSPKSFISIINRWEGNNIRIDKKALVSGIKPILIDFNYLTKHIISQINSNLSTITKSFVLYIEDNNNKEKYKKMIMDLCEETIISINSNIKKLI